MFSRSLRLPAPLMVLAVLALLAGLWSGLVRVGWFLSPVQPGLPLLHGPLMVSGFLGTLIGIERAVGLGLPWCYIGPLLTGIGGLVLILGVPGGIGPLLLTIGSAGLLLDFIVIIRRQASIYAEVMGLGAGVWVVGNVLWFLGYPIPHIVPWYMGFLVMTIAGERLELSRLLRLTPWKTAAFLIGAGLYLFGIFMSLFDFDAGVRIAGAGMIALSLWLLSYDIALKTAGHSGLPRFIALCLIPGYVWLGCGGVLALFYGGVPAGPLYDAMLHAVFLGFVFSMIFGHAPIIIPAVLGAAVPFRTAFYSHLVLLHASLTLRIAGDLAGFPLWTRWGGLINVLSLLLFFLNTASSALKAGRPPQ